MHPFVTIFNDCLSILAGYAMMTITRSRKVHKYNAKRIRQHADNIMDIGMNGVNEVGIPDESEEENDNIYADSDSEEYHSDVEQEYIHDNDRKMAKDQMMKRKKNLFMTIMDVKENMME